MDIIELADLGRLEDLSRNQISIYTTDVSGGNVIFDDSNISLSASFHGILGVGERVLLLSHGLALELVVF